MHDGLAQVLGYVNTKVQAVDAYVRRGAIDEASAQLRELALSARSAYTDVREGIIGLRTLPGPEKNLSEVLREFLQQWKEQSGISADLSMDSDLRLKADVELQLVRIIQEALTNVRKHARATTARVELSSAGGKLLVSIFDDGVGFNPAQKSRGEFPRFGLSTMRERAESVGGTLTIESSPGNGATVRLELPVNQQ
jgi:signal transduction histidine kinase